MSAWPACLAGASYARAQRASKPVYAAAFSIFHGGIAARAPRLALPRLILQGGTTIGEAGILREAMTRALIFLS